MKIFIILIFIKIHYIIPSLSDKEDVFSDYCKPGLCKDYGGDGMHSGCQNGILHNGKFQYPSCPANAQLIPLSEQDKQDILDYHNNQRNYVACGGLYKNYGLRPSCRQGVMTWDKELEKTAFLHISYCTYAHDKCRSTVNYPFSAQNMAFINYNKNINTSAYINIFTYLWYIDHRNIKKELMDENGMVMLKLHILNERNNRVGCSCAKFYWKKNRKDIIMLTCNYPISNVNNSALYNTCQIPGSKCKTGTDPKYKYLCSANEKYDVSGKLNLNPYDGDDLELFQCGRQPELLHLERHGAEKIRKFDKKFVPDKIWFEDLPVESTTKKPEEITTQKSAAVSTTKKPIEPATIITKTINKPTEITTQKPAVVSTTKKPIEPATTKSLITMKTIKKQSGEDDGIFTDYCKPGLCQYFGGDGAHSGCLNGTPHNGKFQTPPCPDNAELITLTESDKQDILDFHNTQRNYVACGGLFKKFGLGPGCRHGVVTWDKELEKTAYLHTSYCTFAHDKCRNTVNYPFSGQNLGIMTYNGKHHSTTTYINTISYMWYIEHRDTKIDMINSFYPQNEVMVGHFLTSLNERNNRVGCTCAKFYWAEKKKNAIMLSCNYPTTNIGKSTVYNSCKKPASKCKTGTDTKYKYLCSSNEKYDVSGKLKHIPYDGDGSEVFECGRQVEMFHREREGAAEVIKQDKNFVPDDASAGGKPGKETTSKPVIKRPSKPVATTKKPKPPCAGNPAAGGVPDYSEEDYDEEDGCLRVWQNFNDRIFILLLTICLLLLQ